MPAIALDPRLESDSIALGNLRFCEVRLMNDARWPWLLLIPQRENISELHDLSPSELNAVTLDSVEAARALKQITGCTKINSAALGNIVRQLHIHVIARNENDANWPGPVWGFGKREDYNESHQAELSAALKDKLFLERNLNAD